MDSSEPTVMVEFSTEELELVAVILLFAVERFDKFFDKVLMSGRLVTAEDVSEILSKIANHPSLETECSVERIPNVYEASEEGPQGGRG